VVSLNPRGESETAVNQENIICGVPESAGIIKDPLTHRVIGCAMQVHNELGPGLDEHFYHSLLSAKLSSSGLRHEFKPRTELLYKGFVADVFEPDVVVSGKVVLELKAQRGGFPPDSLTQILCYLKFRKIGVGLLLDFAKERLLFQRVVYTELPRTELPEIERFKPLSNLSLAQKLVSLLEDIYLTHGLGYRDTTYRGLLIAALRAERIPHQLEPTASIGGMSQAQLRCIFVGEQCVVTVTALGDGVTAADRAVTQTYLRLLKVPWGMAVHFGKRRIDLVIAPKKFPQIPGDHDEEKSSC
jgi:GxxExxY protein